MTAETSTTADTTTGQLDRVLAAAAAAAQPFGASTPGDRAGWLRAVAAALDAHADELVPLAAEETHLAATPRLRGELTRREFSGHLEPLNFPLEELQE